MAQNSHSIDLEYSSSQELVTVDSVHTGIALTSSFTIECWVKLEAIKSQTLVCRIGAPNAGYVLGTGSNGNDLVVIWGTGTTSSQFRVANFFDSNDVGKWVHVAVTVPLPTQNVAMYKNGVQQSVVQNSNGATTISGPNAKLHIGSAYGTQDFFDGKIDEIRIWDTVRTDTEIMNNMCNQLAGTETNLVGYWKLNNTLDDSSPNGNDLTIINGAVFSADTSCSTTGINSSTIEVINRLVI